MQIDVTWAEAYQISCALDNWKALLKRNMEHSQNAESIKMNKQDIACVESIEGKIDIERRRVEKIL